MKFEITIIFTNNSYYLMSFSFILAFGFIFLYYSLNSLLYEKTKIKTLLIIGQFCLFMLSIYFFFENLTCFLSVLLKGFILSIRLSFFWFIGTYIIILLIFLLIIHILFFVITSDNQDFPMFLILIGLLFLIIIINLSFFIFQFNVFDRLETVYIFILFLLMFSWIILFLLYCSILFYFLYDSIYLIRILLLLLTLQTIEIYNRLDIIIQVSTGSGMYKLILCLCLFLNIFFLIFNYTNKEKRFENILILILILLLSLRLYYSYCFYTNCQPYLCIIDDLRILIKYPLEIRLNYCKNWLELFNIIYETRFRLSEQELLNIVENEYDLNIITNNLWSILFSKLIIFEKQKFLSFLVITFISNIYKLFF